MSGPKGRGFLLVRISRRVIGMRPLMERVLSRREILEA